MKKYLETLCQCPLFYQFSQEDIYHLLGCLNAKVTTFNKKETIIYEGSTEKQIGILLSGSAQIIQIDYYGNRTIMGTIEIHKLETKARSDIEGLGTTKDILVGVTERGTETIERTCRRGLNLNLNGLLKHRRAVYVTIDVALAYAYELIAIITTEVGDIVILKPLHTREVYLRITEGSERHKLLIRVRHLLGAIQVVGI